MTTLGRDPATISRVRPGLGELLALDEPLPAMASAVIRELALEAGATIAALWLAAPGARLLELASTTPGPADDGPEGRSRPERVGVPTRFSGAAAAHDWARRVGWHPIALEDRAAGGAETDAGGDALLVGFVALCPDPGAGADDERLEALDLARHELAIAFRGAQLRQELAGEQALLAAILDAANDAIVAVDGSRQVVRVNPAAVRLLGGPPPRQRASTCREALGCGPVRGPGGALRLRCGERCRFEEVLAGPTRLLECEQVVRARDGTDVPVAASYSYMPGPTVGAVAVLRDLRAERAAEELRASFLAAVSHELRTPLSLISGYVDSLLELDLEPDAQRAAVRRIGRSAARLAELVDELLDLTHFETGGLALDRRRVGLRGLVERLSAELAESAGMRALHVAIPPDLPAVDVDATRIGHVLANLVDNARKYGGDAPIAITARRDGSSAIVTVHDRGAGIRPEERARVFDRFYRGRDVVDAGTPGSGLGLYVCRRLVEAHGGRIWVDSVASGNAVSFSLPLALPARRAEAAVA